MGVNNLPRVVAWRCTGWELNPGPLDLEFNTLTTTPPSHPMWVTTIKLVNTEQQPVPMFKPEIHVDNVNKYHNFAPSASTRQV